MNNVSEPVTPEQLRASPDLYYCLRDSRSNLGFRVPLDPVPVSITISERSARSANGQMMLLTLVNTLLRCGRRFSAPVLDVPNVPLFVRIGRFRARHLRDLIAEMAYKVDPHNKLRFADMDFGLRVAIGLTRGMDLRVIAPGVTAAGAVRLATAPFESEALPNPVASVVAANYAVAEVYKHFTPSLGMQPCVDFEQILPKLGHVSLGSALLVGAGGIAHALGWLLQWLDWTGEIAVLDFDPVDTSNLNRYFCAFIDDVGRSKPQTFCDFIDGVATVRVVPVEGCYERLRDVGVVKVSAYSSVITVVDNVTTRLEAQADLPRLLFNAGTNSWSFQASRHDLSHGACLGCLFPPVRGAGHGRRVRCDERIDKAEQPPTESFSFVTGLAGPYLALQIAAGYNQSLGNLPNQYHGSGLNVSSLVADDRKKDPECPVFCAEQCVQDRLKSKYSAIDEPIAKQASPG